MVPNRITLDAKWIQNVQLQSKLWFNLTRLGNRFLCVKGHLIASTMHLKNSQDLNCSLKQTEQITSHLPRFKRKIRKQVKKKLDYVYIFNRSIWLYYIDGKKSVHTY